MGKKKSLFLRLVVKHREHIRPLLINYKWTILSILVLVTIALGYRGFTQAAYEGNFPEAAGYSVVDFIFVSIRLFGMGSANSAINPPLTLEIARVLAPAITIFAILLVVTSSLYEHIAFFWICTVRRKHTIVCGLGYLGPVITRTLLNMGYFVVVIEKDPDNPALDSVRGQGALVVIGDAEGKDTLNRAHLSTARGLFAVTGDDAKNIAIYLKCADMLAEPRLHHPINCYIHIEDRNLYRIYDAKNLGKFIPAQNINDTPAERKEAGMQTFFFNLYWSAASCLLQKYPFIHPDLKEQLAKRMEILHSGERAAGPEAGTEPPVDSILVAGLGTLGESLILEAAFEWWIWFGHTGKKLNLILVDRDAAEKEKILTARYPSVARYCSFEAVDSDVLSSTVTDGSFLFHPDNRPRVSHIYLCFADETLSLTAAVRFRKLLQTADVPIIFRTTRDEMFDALVRQYPEKDRAHWHLSAFPLASCECCMDEILYHGTDTRLAMRIHQNYLTREFRKGQTLKDNPNLVPWKDLPREMRESNRRQAAKFANAVLRKGYSFEPLRNWNEPLIWFTHEEVESLAAEEHDSWVNEKRGLGYQYGPEKNEKKKTHPGVLEWPDLHDDQRMKDRDAIRALPRLFAEIGQRVVKR